MRNTKQKLRKNILVIGILSAILLSGCSKENVPKEELPMDSGIESTVAEKDSMPEEKKASYPADNPEDITLWMDNSGGAMTDFMLFKECGPG